MTAIKIVNQRALLPTEYWHLLEPSKEGRPPMPEELGWCETTPCDDCMKLDTANLRLDPGFRRLADAIDANRDRSA